MGLFDSIFRSTKSYGNLSTTEGTYEGDLVNDKPHGKGVFSFNDGGRYERFLPFLKGGQEGLKSIWG